MTDGSRTTASMAIATVASEHLVPEETAIAMIERLSSQLESVSSLADIKRVITQAEAIDLVMRKIRASEAAKAASFRLLLESEKQLGRISKTIPRGRGESSKGSRIRAHGLRVNRCLMAEKLAVAPERRIEAAVAGQVRPTLTGTSAALGIKHVTPYVSDKRARDLTYLANEAIEMLERCADKNQVPHPGTVINLRSWLERIRIR